MPQPTPSAIPLETIVPWLALIGFGAYHGVNPGMGWLFALSLGLQQRSERAIWTALIPIAVGHAASITIVAVIVLAGLRFISTSTLQLITAVVLLAFGAYKLYSYYRHPHWVGMKVGMRDLFAWSFLMATAHGAGLMIAPALVGVAAAGAARSAGLMLGVAAHTAAMLAVMGGVAWIVYKKLGLSVLRQKWVNFDLIWAVALIGVGAISLVTSA